MDAVPGFTREYKVKVLVYYELHATMYAAITREKQLKKWNREWKLRLIEKSNPDWIDLWDQTVAPSFPRSGNPSGSPPTRG